jgi:hypothetical protein
MNRGVFWRMNMQVYRHLHGYVIGGVVYEPRLTAAHENE